MSKDAIRFSVSKINKKYYKTYRPDRGIGNNRCYWWNEKSNNNVIELFILSKEYGVKRHDYTYSFDDLDFEEHLFILGQTDDYNDVLNDIIRFKINNNMLL